MSGGYPDIGKEVERFLSGYDRLKRLPLISDDETAGLFSAAVKEMLDRLGRYDQDQKLCASCSDRCCKLVVCELYHPSFNVCPAYNLRPLLCRMHYCYKYAPAYEKEVKLVGDLFLESLIALENMGCLKTALFDSPPLAPAAPRLAEKTLPLMADFRAGRLDRTAALQALRAETEKYRMHP